MEPHVAEGQRLIMCIILLRDLAPTLVTTMEGTMGGTAEGAEKEEAKLLDMAPLCALYVRHIYHPPPCTPSALCVPPVGWQCNFMLGAVTQVLQQQICSSSLLATD